MLCRTDLLLFLTVSIFIASSFSCNSYRFRGYVWIFLVPWFFYLSFLFKGLCHRVIHEKYRARVGFTFTLFPQRVTRITIFISNMRNTGRKWHCLINFLENGGSKLVKLELCKERVNKFTEYNIQIFSYRKLITYSGFYLPPLNLCSLLLQ